MYLNDIMNSLKIRLLAALFAVYSLKSGTSLSHDEILERVQNDPETIEEQLEKEFNYKGLSEKKKREIIHLGAVILNGQISLQGLRILHRISALSGKNILEVATRIENPVIVYNEDGKTKTIDSKLILSEELSPKNRAELIRRMCQDMFEIKIDDELLKEIQNLRYELAKTKGERLRIKMKPNKPKLRPYHTSRRV